MKKRKITKIEAKKAIKKLNVAAYCRVSTMMESQSESLDNQKVHYETLIAAHDQWANAGIYYDEGITGTKKELRPGLKKLMDDCEEGKIDLILTKSISRFARNTSDCLEMVRKLKALNVRIIFEKENIDTSRSDSEFILTILSSLAEEESHSTSNNEKWRFQKQFEDGSYRFKQAPYGYKWKDGRFIKDDVDGETVKWMFQMVLEGKGTTWIAKKLNEKSIPTRRHKKWSSGTVLQIIHNVAYIGDVVLKKTYKDKNYKVYRNLGEKPQYYVDHHHEALIDEETFYLAQQAVNQRGKEKGASRLPPEKRVERKDKHHQKYSMTSKLVCGCCGHPMKRVSQYTKKGTRIHYTCTNHQLDHKACSMKRVLEENIENAFVTMLHKLYYISLAVDWYSVQKNKEKSEAQRARLDDIAQELKENTAARQRLNELLSVGCLSDVDYQQKMIDLQNNASALQDERYRLKTKDDQVSAFRYFITHDGQLLQKFDSSIFNEYVKKVVVHSPTHFTFELMCGLSLEEEMK